MGEGRDWRGKGVEGWEGRGEGAGGERDVGRGTGRKDGRGRDGRGEASPSRPFPPPPLPSLSLPPLPLRPPLPLPPPVPLPHLPVSPPCLPALNPSNFPTTLPSSQASPLKLLILSNGTMFQGYVCLTSKSRSVEVAGVWRCGGVIKPPKPGMRWKIQRNNGFMQSWLPPLGLGIKERAMCSSPITDHSSNFKADLGRPDVTLKKVI